MAAIQDPHVTSGLVGGSGNGYRFAELGVANNPSGPAGVLKVKIPA